MRIAVKVGTSTLTHSTGQLNLRRVEQLCKVLADLKNSGHELILISSGAIGMGAAKLNLATRPQDMATKQAAAAVGQCELMYIYDKLFSEYHHTVAQVLLTAEDIGTPARRKHIESTLNRLLELKVLPVINENDTVSTQEIRVGDNDTLSAITAATLKADLLIILSDIAGLYTKDPHKYEDAVLIEQVKELSADIMELGAASASNLGTGGMTTKLYAAKIATQQGVTMVIANGADPSNLYDIIEGKPVGTTFLPKRRDET